MRSCKFISFILTVAVLITSAGFAMGTPSVEVSAFFPDANYTWKTTADTSDSVVYLPIVIQDPQEPVVPPPPISTRRVNVPHFEDSIRFTQTAIVWFGEVTPTNNYVDVRIGYNQDELYVRAAIFDRLLWYDTSPESQNLTDWDSMSLFLYTADHPGELITPNAYRFDSQLSDGPANREAWQAAYQGDGDGWVLTDIPFTSISGYSWESDYEGGLNNGDNNRGWLVLYRIPFSSFGLSGPPAEGTLWGLGMSVQDRDDAEGSPIADQVWPEGLLAQNPNHWGELLFGVPGFSPGASTYGGTVTVQHGVDGMMVKDAHAGGHSVCGEGMDFWTEWGERNYSGYEQFVVQNQANLADWPCFSKIFITFPLDSIPTGKVIRDAKLTIIHFGNSQPSDALRSWIQVLTVGEEWEEATLNWNNAPLAVENITGTWVEPLLNEPEWPGVPIDWDVSRAVEQAYQSGEPLRLALYSADGAQHSGKYFYSSDAYGAAKPMLTVEWGEP